jgi:hypothetical protein
MVLFYCSVLLSRSKTQRNTTKQVDSPPVAFTPSSASVHLPLPPRSKIDHEKANHYETIGNGKPVNEQTHVYDKLDDHFVSPPQPANDSRNEYLTFA